MPGRLHPTPSLHSMALPHLRPVPFVLPRRRHSSEDKPRIAHSASAELVSRIEPRKFTMDAAVTVANSQATPMTVMSSPPRPKLARPSPRRCNSDPNSSTIITTLGGGAGGGGAGAGGGGGGGDVLVSSSGSRRQPRRCNSEPNDSEADKTSSLEEESPSPTPIPIRKKPPLSHKRSTLSETSSESSYTSLRNCDVLRAYQEAVDFQEKLREDYETSKRVFILFRYRRLRSLIRQATVEHHLQHLRQAVRTRCSCGGGGGGGGSRGPDGGEGRRGGCVRAVGGMVDEVLEVVRPAFTKVKACLQSAMQFVAQPLLLRSTPSLHNLSPSSAPPSPSSCSSPEHEWQRSRLVLLERHLERLKRECLSSHRSSLPLSKYKSMKNNLKNVMTARMV